MASDFFPYLCQIEVDSQEVKGVCGRGGGLFIPPGCLQQKGQEGGL